LELSIPSSEAYPPILGHLNYYRELYREQVPHPLLIWLPEYALTALARGAPDFWAWRSGLYELTPDREETDDSFQPLKQQTIHASLSLSAQRKRGRLTNLKGLLAEYRELGTGPHERQAQGRILHDIATFQESLGEWHEAGQAFAESLAIAREDGDPAEVAHRLGHLATVAGKQGDLLEAMRLCCEAIHLELENKPGLCSALTLAGGLLLRAAKYEEAKRFTELALDIARELDVKVMLEGIFHQLGLLAQLRGDLDESQRWFEESLRTDREMGYTAGIAPTLHQLGLLAQQRGDYTEAWRLSQEALEIEEDLGDRSSIARTLHQLGELAEKSGDYTQARTLYEQSMAIDREMGHIDGELRNLTHLLSLDKREGKQDEVIRHSEQAKKARQQYRELIHASTSERDKAPEEEQPDRGAGTN
jgi:tetratricopeptide (TPR) repeat protein